MELLTLSTLKMILLLMILGGAAIMNSVINRYLMGVQKRRDEESRYKDQLDAATNNSEDSRDLNSDLRESKKFLDD